MKNKIKIFVIGHKNFDVPKSNILVPIQAGSSINKSIKGILRDDEGDNISSKNQSYSELTAQYYAIKNEDADYYGFFHYRRYLNFSPNTTNKPYVYYSKKIENLGDFINLDNAAEIILNYDILLPRPENFHMTVREQYNTSSRHIDKEALDNILEITKEIYPDYTKDINDYIDGYENFLGNMYIMKKNIAIQYFNFLFDILNKFDSLYEDLPLRTHGFLSERLFGIFFYHLKRTTSLKYSFLQRVDVLKYYDKKMLRKLTYLLLPPSSKIRAICKSILKKNK